MKTGDWSGLEVTWAVWGVLMLALIFHYGLMG